MHRVVIALGGNALLRRGAPDTYEEMYAAARTAAERIATSRPRAGKWW